MVIYMNYLVEKLLSDMDSVTLEMVILIIVCILLVLAIVVLSIIKKLNK
jgi:hypothetical protein